MSNSPAPTRLLSDALGYLPAILVPAVVALVSATVFTRIFPPAEYGHFTFALSVIGPIATLLTQWLAQPLERYYAEYNATGHLPLLHLVVRRALYGIVTAVAVIGGTLSVVLRETNRDGDTWLLVIGGVLALAAQVTSFIALPLLTASFRVGLYRRFLVLSAVGSFLISLILVLVVSRNVAWLLWGHALGVAVLLPTLMRETGLSRATQRVELGGGEMRAMVRRILAYGVPMALWFVAMAILAISDRYVLEAVRGTAEQAIYTVTYNLIGSIAGLANVPVNVAVGPILYSAWAAGRRSTLEDTISRMTEMYAILAIALVGGVVVVGEAFVRIVLAVEYHGGALILAPVVVGIAVQGAANIGRKGLELHERTTALVVSAAVAALVNVTLNLLLVPAFGFVAAAYTTTASYFIYALMIGITSARVLPWHVPSRQVLGLFGIGAIACSLGWLSTQMVSAKGPYTQFVTGGLAFLIAYTLLLWVFRRQRLKTLFAAT